MQSPIHPRREFLRQSLALVAWLAATDVVGNPLGNKPKTVLLRSSWQTLNIGDIGHTPGALQLFKQYLPGGTRVILWPDSVDNGVAEILQSRFPDLVIAEGELDAAGKPKTPALQAAFAQADVFVHGSGPMLLAQKDMEAWRIQTGKPYGVFGITIGGELNDKLADLLNGAAFVYLRDTVSLQRVQARGIKAPVLAFGPDATFAMPLRNPAQAQAYLKAQGLVAKQFICVIPRLRYTAYYQLHNTPPTAEDLRRDAVSEQFREVDHAKMREVIIAWVRQTGLKVLACPEMTYEVELAKAVLVDPLPDDVKKNVVWRSTYWLPDEATSVYERARALVSLEMHSPIMACQANTPALLVRQPTDSSKGQMWADIGLGDWSFEIDNTTGSQIAGRLLEVHRNYPAALKKLAAARALVQQQQRKMVGAVANALQG